MIYYVFSIHMPLLQGEQPTIAVLEVDSPKILAIKILACRGRLFHENVMSEVARLSEGICAIKGVDQIQAHLVFSGAAFNAYAVDQLLEGRWPAGSYSYAVPAAASGEPRMQTMAKSTYVGHPINRFIVPRLAIISLLNLAYAEPGRLTIAISDEEGAKLRRQLDAFSDRSVRISTSDPEALMEHAGEGDVIALGLGTWFADSSAQVMAAWGRDQLEAA